MKTNTAFDEYSRVLGCLQNLGDVIVGTTTPSEFAYEINHLGASVRFDETGKIRRGIIPSKDEEMVFGVEASTLNRQCLLLGLVTADEWLEHASQWMDSIDELKTSAVSIATVCQVFRRFDILVIRLNRPHWTPDDFVEDPNLAKLWKTLQRFQDEYLKVVANLRLEISKRGHHSPLTTLISDVKKPVGTTKGKGRGKQVKFNANLRVLALFLEVPESKSWKSSEVADAISTESIQVEESTVRKTFTWKTNRKSQQGARTDRKCET